MTNTTAFCIYMDWEEQLSELTDEERGQIFSAIFEYKRTGVVPKLPRILSLVFSFIRQQLDRDAEKYEQKVLNRSEAGKKGGAPKGNNNAKKSENESKKTNKTDSKQAKQTKQADTITDTITITNNNIYTHTHTHARGEYENVFISDDEESMLISQLGEKRYKDSIECLSRYIKRKPEYSSASHFEDLRGWVQDRINRLLPSKDNKTERIHKAGLDVDLDDIFERGNAG